MPTRHKSIHQSIDLMDSIRRADLTMDLLDRPAPGATHGERVTHTPTRLVRRCARELALSGLLALRFAIVPLTWIATISLLWWLWLSV